MSNEQPQVLFVDAVKRPGIERFIDQILSWMITPERPFYCALLEGHDGMSMLQRWVRNPDSELALHTTRLAVVDDRVGGGYTGFAGRQLQRRRETDIVDLARRSPKVRSRQLRRRLCDLMPLFAPVAPDDFYISKFGVSSDVDVPELRTALIQECLERADADGFGRVRIDIDAGREQLYRLLTYHGFDTFDRGCAEDAGITYLNMVCEL